MSLTPDDRHSAGSPPHGLNLGSVLLFLVGLCLTLTLIAAGAVWLLAYRLWCQLSATVPDSAPGTWFYDLGGSVLEPLRVLNVAGDNAPGTVEIAILAAIPLLSLVGLLAAVGAYLCWTAYPAATARVAVRPPRPRMSATQPSSLKKAGSRLKAGGATSADATKRWLLLGFLPRWRQADDAVRDWLLDGRTRVSVWYENQLKPRARATAQSWQNEWARTGPWLRSHISGLLQHIEGRVHATGPGSAGGEHSAGDASIRGANEGEGWGSETMNRREFLRNVLHR